jgi:hypothetical protein
MERGLLLSVLIGLSTGIALLFTFAFAPVWFHYVLPISAENTFGLDARFVYALHGTNPCLARPCYNPPTHYLVTRYEKPVFILGYNICDLDKFSLASGTKACLVTHEESGIGAVRDYPSYTWKYLGIQKGFEIDDTVSIRVKAAPLKVSYEDGTERWSYDVAEARWFELGKTRILKVASSQDFTGRQQVLFER